MSDARSRILETASKLFLERGYELVGINELIASSGVAKATFYQHFRSKETLCLEWLRGVAAELEAEARALLESPIDPEEKIRKHFDSLADYLKATEFRGCPFSNTAVVMLENNTVRALVDQHKAAVRHFWQSIALEIQASLARELGDGFFLLFSGAITEAQNAKALWPVDSAKTAALHLCRPFSKS